MRGVAVCMASAVLALTILGCKDVRPQAQKPVGEIEFPVYEKWWE